MKKLFKQNAGLTLIELVVAMAMATIVTAAATSVLLMGLRINRQTGDTASQQITVRSLLNVMEDAASGGGIKGVVSEYDSWQLLDSAVAKDDQGKLTTTGRVIFGFDSESQLIYSNGTMESGVVTSTGTTILEGVIASNVIMEGQLLSISIETRDGIYTSSIYCRTVTPGPSYEPPEFVVGSDFILVLRSQLNSRGEIKGENTYYSQWYCGGTYWKGWDFDTPWCACFVSWALKQVDMPAPDYCNDPKHTSHTNWYANVDEFMEYFKYTKQTDSRWEDSEAHGGTYSPEKGDLIFFDWDKGTDPEHIGVVINISVDGDYVFTIEGNSAGRVAIRSYPISDKRIIGYGVLWPKKSQG